MLVFINKTSVIYCYVCTYYKYWVKSGRKAMRGWVNIVYCKYVTENVLHPCHYKENKNIQTYRQNISSVFRSIYVTCLWRDGNINMTFVFFLDGCSKVLLNNCTKLQNAIEIHMDSISFKSHLKKKCY